MSQLTSDSAKRAKTVMRWLYPVDIRPSITSLPKPARLTSEQLENPLQIIQNLYAGCSGSKYSHKSEPHKSIEAIRQTTAQGNVKRCSMLSITVTCISYSK